MKIIRYTFITALAAALTGCSISEEALSPVTEGQTITTTFTARQEPGTKTAIDGKTVKWQPGDAISILDGTNNVRAVAGNISEDGLTATFTADVAASGTYYAIYPYSEENTLKNGKVHVKGPGSTQDGKFGSSHIAAAAVSGMSRELQFHNITGGIRFSISDKSISYVTFEGKSGKGIPAEADLSFDGQSISISGTGAGTIKIELDGSGDYYAGMLPSSLTNGFVMTAYDSKGQPKCLATSDKALPVSRSNITRLGAIESHSMTYLTLADFRKKSDGSGPFVVGGVISGTFQTTYGNFFISDGTGEIEIYGLLTPQGEAKKQYIAAGLEDGDFVTVYGKKKTFTDKSGKKIIEIENATYISHTKQGGEGEEHGPEEISVAEFLDLPGTDARTYIVTGEITSVENTDYGNFHINDGTGSLYIYGLLTPDGVARKQFAAAGLETGDIITVKGSRTNYNGTIEMKNAIYVSHSKPEIGEAFLSETLCGVYRYNGSSAVTRIFGYDEDTDQISRGYLNGLTFRVMNPGVAKFLELSGIPETLKAGDKITVTVRENYVNSLDSSYSMTVKKVQDGLIWLTAGSLGFIVKQ